MSFGGLPRIVTPGFEKDPRTGAWYCTKCGSERIEMDGHTLELRCLNCGYKTIYGRVIEEEPPPESPFEEAAKHPIEQPAKRIKPKRPFTV